MMSGTAALTLAKSGQQVRWKARSMLRHEYHRWEDSVRKGMLPSVAKVYHKYALANYSSHFIFIPQAYNLHRTTTDHITKRSQSTRNRTTSFSIILDLISQRLSNHQSTIDLDLRVRNLAQRAASLARRVDCLALPLHASLPFCMKPTAEKNRAVVPILPPISTR
jgi:hypothetical protein